MSEANKAVFLSYASQDAEATKHICDALRAADVEVWFDQSALRGGDAWDAKIRKQIKECALFVPIISPNTQARTEGYFRLEWRLADQRTHLMGKSKPFLVPVAINRASEADADVPDSFMAVQWTKLSDGEIPAGFVGRIRTLLGDAPGESEPPRTAERNAAAPFASRRKSRRFWWVPASLALVAGVTVLIWQPWRGVVRSSTADREAPPSPAGGSHAEAQRLVAKVWEQLIKMDLWRPELDRADELCSQATALEPNNADAWAAWSQVDSWSIYYGFGSLAKTADRAHEKLSRALVLAPSGFEPRLAQACFLVRGGGESALSPLADQAEALLRGLLRERPEEPRVLLALGILLRNSSRADETRAVFERLAAQPAFAAFAMNELGWAEFHFGDWDAAERAADRSIAMRPVWGNLNLKLFVALWLRADPAAAKAMLTRIPARVLQDDRGLWLVCEVYFGCNEPESVLQTLASVSRPWLSSSAYTGPTSLLLGEAHAAAGHPEAAELNWRSGLKLVEERLIEAPQSAVLLNLKGALTAKLGRRAEAEKYLKLARELAVGDQEALSLIGPITLDQVLLGDFDGAVKSMENDVRAGGVYGHLGFLKYSRYYRLLHGYPAFEALLTKLANHAANAGAEPPATAVAKPLGEPMRKQNDMTRTAPALEGDTHGLNIAAVARFLVT